MSRELLAQGGYNHSRTAATRMQASVDVSRTVLLICSVSLHILTTRQSDSCSFYAEQPGEDGYLPHWSQARVFPHSQTSPNLQKIAGLRTSSVGSFRLDCSDQGEDPSKRDGHASPTGTKRNCKQRIFIHIRPFHRGKRMLKSGLILLTRTRSPPSSFTSSLPVTPFDPVYPYRNSFHPLVWLLRDGNNGLSGG